MSKKTIIIFIILIILALGGWVFISSRQQAPVGQDGTSGGFFSSFFPFGTTDLPDGTGTDTGGGTGSGTTGGGGKPLADSRLVQVSNKITAGHIALSPTNTPVIPTYDINDNTGATEPRPADTLPIVRFAERGTGYIYDANAEGQNLRKVAGTVIARTAQALFGNGGDSVILRYIKNDNQTVATFLGRIVPADEPSGTGELQGSFLPENISDVTLSNDGKNVLFLLPTAGGSAGMTMKIDGSGRKQIFTSSFSEWLTDWPSTGPVLTSKAASGISGYAYLVNSAGNLSKILGGVNGLTTKMSPDGKFILYSVSGDSAVTLHVRRIQDGTTVDTGLRTLPEKCVWSASSLVAYCGATNVLEEGLYPDFWYQGLVHFTDSFWKIDPSTGTTSEQSDGEGNELDAMNLALSQNDEYLFFINKRDSSLWSLNLKPTTANN